MRYEEFSDQFDVAYNNITSNQAAGLTEYEKSVFLTKAQNEIIKNYFTANSKGNNIGQGFDDSAKRQADFSSLMSVEYAEPASDVTMLDRRASLWQFSSIPFIIINERVEAIVDGKNVDLQVIPLRYDEYTRLMSKPFKRPVKNQAWRLNHFGNASTWMVELIIGPNASVQDYVLRFLRKPKPIIVGDLDGLTIDGYSFGTGTNKTQGCELDSILHEDILQRAVELAKVAWTSTGQDNTNAVLQAGQRSE